MISIQHLMNCNALRRMPVVFHVGTLNPADKRPTSYEGDGVSVSVHPDAWRRIARLGDAPLHRLSHPQGCFLDVYAFQVIGSWMELMWQWNLAQGFVERGSYWTVSTPDYESGLDAITKWRDQASAEAEASMHDEVRVAEVDGYLPTAAMNTRMWCWSVPLAFTLDFALLLWAEACLPHVHGLWWNDTLHVAQFSAPRGVIFPSRIGEWQRTQQPTLLMTQAIRPVRLLVDDRDQHVAEGCDCGRCNANGVSFGVSILDERELTWDTETDINPSSVDDARLERVYGASEAAALETARLVCIERGWWVADPSIA